MPRPAASPALASFAFLTAAAFALGSCGPINRGLESVNQPVVSRTDYVFDVAAGGYGLAPGEAARVAAWFASLDVGYGDRITLDDPAHYGGAAAREAVAAAAARYGLLLGDTAPVTAGTIAPGMVRVIVSRASADVPNCPNWNDGPVAAASSSTAANYGCAVNSNLAAMVADPQDLIHGHAANDGGPNARVTAKALKAYRDTAPTGAGSALKAESTGGK